MIRQPKSLGRLCLGIEGFAKSFSHRTAQIKQPTDVAEIISVPSACI